MPNDTSPPSPSFEPYSFGAGFPSDRNPHNEGYKLFITATLFVFLAALFVTVRVWARVQKRNAGGDDLTIVVSLMLSFALTISIDLAVASGYGVKKANLTDPQKRAAMKWFFISQIIYKCQIMMTKTSLILLYLRIFIARSFRRACFLALAVVVLWSLGSVLSTIFQCVPIQLSWGDGAAASGASGGGAGGGGGGGECTNSDVNWYQYGIVNILTDVMIFALPVKQVLGLQLGRRERFALLGVFLMGAFVCVVSVCRVIVVANSTQMKEDPTGNFIPRSSLTLVEANVGIICACLPMLRRPLSFLFARNSSNRNNTSGQSSSLRPNNNNSSSRSRPLYELSKGPQGSVEREGRQSSDPSDDLEAAAGLSSRDVEMSRDDRLGMESGDLVGVLGLREASQEELMPVSWSTGDESSSGEVASANGRITVTRDYEVRRS